MNHPLLDRLLLHDWKIVIDADDVATRAQLLRPEGAIHAVATSFDIPGLDAQAALDGLEAFAARMLADDYHHQLTKPKLEPPRQ